jgi:hypothetical protein
VKYFEPIFTDGETKEIANYLISRISLIVVVFQEPELNFEQNESNAVFMICPSLMPCIIRFN